MLESDIMTLVGAMCASLNISAAVLLISGKNKSIVGFLLNILSAGIAFTMALSNLK